MTTVNHTDADDTANGRVAELKSAATDAIGAARGKVGHAYEGAADKTAAAIETARARASEARERAAAGIDANPAIAFLGGIAIGALIGALLPRSERERQALAPLGERIRTAAAEAGRAAREAGQGKLDELGLNKDAATEKVKSFVGDAVSAAGSVGGAAVKAVRSEQG